MAGAAFGVDQGDRAVAPGAGGPTARRGGARLRLVSVLGRMRRPAATTVSAARTSAPGAATAAAFAAAIRRA